MFHPMPAERWSRVEDLFFQVSAAPEASRDAILNAGCAGDSELRDEVMSLLRYDEAGHPELDAALGTGAAWIVAGDSLEGWVLGAYRIERELGRGGMSVVYLAARDDGEFRKQVAIKLIKRGMDTDALMDRLRRERRILAGLEHPYIARLLDGGTAPDGRPYIVMEYVEGLQIDDFCEQNRLSPRQRCELFEKVCAAVAYANRKLVVHRDLKPANILVAPDGAPRLLDFGVAAVLEGDPFDESRPQTRSQYALTPEYASPEQLSGIPSGTATDVFSLGVVLYELLAGVRPYGKGTAESGTPPTLASVAALHRGHTRAWSRQLEGDLNNILRKALDPDPDRRYLSVEQLESDLIRYRSGLPVAARPESLLYQAGKFLRRHRFGSLAAAAAILAMVAGLGATLWQSRAAQNQRDIAEHRRIDAERQRLRAESLQHQAEENAREAAVAHDDAETQRARAEVEKAAAESGRAMADRRFQQVRELARKFTTDVHDAIAPLPGSTEARKMLVETGLRYYDTLAAEAAGNSGLLMEVARGYERLGDAQGNPYYANLGDRAGALASYRKALAVRSRVSDTSPAFLAERILGNVKMAQVLTPQGDFSMSAAVLADALKLAENTPAAQDYGVRQALARTLVALGDLKSQRGVYSEAVELYERLLVVWTSLAQSGHNPPVERAGISLAHTKLGETYARMERGPQALAHLRPALEIDTDLAAREPNSIPRLRKVYFDYLFMGWVFRSESGANLGSDDEARKVLDQATHLARRMADADAGNTMAFKDVASAQLTYATWLRAKKEYAASLEHFRSAAEAVDRFTAGGSHTLEFDDARVEIQEYLGRACISVGQPDEAIVHLATARETLAGLLKRYPSVDHLERRRAEIEASTGSAWRLKQDWTRALASFEEAVTILKAQRLKDPKNDSVRSALPSRQADLAECYLAVGRKPDAQNALEAALASFGDLESSRPLAPEETELRAEVKAKLIAMN